MIADPLFFGALQVMSRAESAPVTVGAAICSGATSISTWADGAEGSDVPASLCATTVNLWYSPFDSPVTCTPGLCVLKVSPEFRSVTV